MENVFPLTDYVIRNDKHILFRQPHTAHFHCSSDHNVGFSGTDVVSKKSVRSKDDTCHRILLVGIKVYLRRHIRKPQKRSVKNSSANTTEFVLKNPFKSFFSCVILPNPFLKFFYEFLLLFNCRCRFCFIDNTLYAGSVGGAADFVLNGNGLHVQCLFKDIERFQFVSSISIADADTVIIS